MQNIRANRVNTQVVSSTMFQGENADIKNILCNNITIIGDTNIVGGTGYTGYTGCTGVGWTGIGWTGGTGYTGFTGYTDVSKLYTVSSP